MCTLSYIPKEEKYILTSNRDEHDSRALTAFPVKKSIEGQEVFFPQDPKAGGTWLATSNKNKTAVLLNGAFEAHPYHPPYGLSRGILLLDSYRFKNMPEFMENYDFQGIEPFTLLHFNTKGEQNIDELRWDGERLYHKTLSASKAHIWSSTMLYPPEVRKQREEWFNELLRSDPDSNEMSHFHHFGGYSDEENKLKMDRGNGLRTISISQIIIKKNETSFLYQNLVTEKDQKIFI